MSAGASLARGAESSSPGSRPPARGSSTSGEGRPATSSSSGSRGRASAARDSGGANVPRCCGTASGQARRSPGPGARSPAPRRGPGPAAPRAGERGRARMRPVWPRRPPRVWAPARLPARRWPRAAARTGARGARARHALRCQRGSSVLASPWPEANRVSTIGAQAPPTTARPVLASASSVSLHRSSGAVRTRPGAGRASVAPVSARGQGHGERAVSPGRLTRSETLCARGDCWLAGPGVLR